MLLILSSKCAKNKNSMTSAPPRGASRGASRNALLPASRGASLPASRGASLPASRGASLPEDCWELIVQCYVRIPAPEDFETEVVLLEIVARDSGIWDHDVRQVHHFHHYETARRVCRSWRDWAAPFLPAAYLPAIMSYVSPMAGAPALGPVTSGGRILGWHSSVPEQPPILVIVVSGTELYVPRSAEQHVDCLAFHFYKFDLEDFFRPPQSRTELFVESGHFIDDHHLAEQLLQLAMEKEQT